MDTDAVTAQATRREPVARAWEATIAELAQLVRQAERAEARLDTSPADRNRWRSCVNLRDAATFVLYISAVVLLIGVVSAEALGYRLLVIKSGSMEPTLDVGAVVVSRAVRPLDIYPGEIVTFRDPTYNQQLVTHRVISKRQHGPNIDFVTKGDANRTSERWRVPINATIGKEVFAVPFVGRILNLSRPIAVTAVIAFAAFWLTALALRRIWTTTTRGRQRQPTPQTAEQHVITV